METRLKAMIDDLTAAESKVATALLADYPFAGLSTVTDLAKRSQVSTQTIFRLISKLGFAGYAEFQRALIGEIKERYHSPVILHETLAGTDTDANSLEMLADASIAAVRQTVASVPEAVFEAVCNLIADRRRSVFLIGGRISYTLADFLFRHLRQVRSKVYRIPDYHEDWPDYLLRIARKDVVIIFDYRRYQADLESFAEKASRDRGGQVVLLTDKWLSPVSRHSSHILASAIDVGTPWDTSLGPLLLIEAIINRVAEEDWVTARRRIEQWDALRLNIDDHETPGAVPDRVPKQDRGDE
ncbi:MAG: MurR/RpiR family transcriptional regulator, partial [Aestuariivirgaceae bacterium]